MLFHSLEFAIFFPIVFGLYLVLEHKWQNRMLLLASYVFYGAWDWRFLSLLLVSTIVDYFCGKQIENTDDKRIKKRFVSLSLFINLSLLGVFKYYDFFALSFKNLVGTFGLSVDPFLLNIILPIGISFYTFQTISYTIDVSRGKVKACRNILDFGLYVSFFPQLIAGPIERGTRLLPQILSRRTVTIEGVYTGAYFFIWGLFLKVFGADNLAKAVDVVFIQDGGYSGINVVISTYAFALQIYCDFAGYSFMAIGLGRAMGIELMENFRRPYFAHNISDFWRRWHISLSSWFRDYVFSPFYIYCGEQLKLKNLSMKMRHGIAFFVALLLTEAVLGLWHGAGWNFVFFGIYHGLAIWAYYLFRRAWDRMNRFVQIFFTFNVACVGWLIFRAPTLSQSWEMILSLFTNFQLDLALLPQYIGIQVFFLVSILVTVQILQERKNDALVVLTWPVYIRYPFIAFLFLLIIVFGDFGGRPFIYFQF